MVAQGGAHIKIYELIIYRATASSQRGTTAASVRDGKIDTEQLDDHSKNKGRYKTMKPKKYYY